MDALAWPVVTLIRASPQIIETVFFHRREARRLRIEEDRWQLERDRLRLRIADRRRAGERLE